MRVHKSVSVGSVVACCSDFVWKSSIGRLGGNLVNWAGLPSPLKFLGDILAPTEDEIATKEFVTFCLAATGS